MSEQTMTFEEWCKELNRIGRENYDLNFDYTEATGVDCWQEMYEDGMTPTEAWSEEEAAARSMM